MANAEKRGKSWRVRYKQPDGTWGSESGFPTKSAAMKRGNDLEADIRHGRYVDPKKARTPFGEWAAEWMAAQDVAPNTVAKRRRLLKNHLMPKWEHTPLCDINLFAAKAWANQLTCAASTKRHVMTLLSMILTGAADAGCLLANPLYGRRISKKSSKKTAAAPSDEEVWAQPEDAYAIAQRLIGVSRLMVITAAWMGFRWGELTGLHKSNCLLLRSDKLNGKPWARHVIRIDPAVGSLHEVEVALTEEELEAWRTAEDERIAKGLAAGRSPRRKKEPENRVELFLGPPKNETSAREVDVPSFLVDLLSQHMATWPHEYVFSTPSEGQHWRRGNFGRQQLRPAADGRAASERRPGTAGRPGWEPILPNLTMRGLRHTHDTWMKEDRIDRSLRFLTMGWAVQDIEGVYEHVTPQMRKDRLDGLEARWERARRGGAREPLRVASGS
jgi:integrase